MNRAFSQRAIALTAGILGVVFVVVALVLVAVTSRDDVGSSDAALMALLAVAALMSVLALAVALQSAPHGPSGFETDADSRPEDRVVAHELRGPLSVAVGHLDLALSAWTGPDEVTAHVARATRAVERADALISTLLGPGTATLGQHEPVDLAVLVDETLMDFDPQARRRGLTISVMHTGERPEAAGGEGPASEGPGAATVLGDPRELRQVLDNVVSNAVKYADQESWIDIAVGSDPDGATRHVTVTNAGCTLTAVEAADVFAPRSRGAAAATLAPGEGIGLAVVHDVVAAHHGTATLDADPEAGTTTLRIDLPAHSI